METSKLKQFAQYARRFLRETVSAKLNVVLAQESSARRENPKAIDSLEKQIKIHGEDQVVERVAYTWFNRFCALRFMDVNRYHRTSVLSPIEGQTQPEILAEVKMGAVNEEMIPQKTAEKITGLLQNTIPSQDPQNEAYRLIVVSVCNFWHKTMPFLFQRIDDYTELLMPDDLLSGNSIISYVREAMTSDACKDVEVIGWLYQFYISEKKDEVFAGLKKNKKVTPENIPAATQLFTPNWIVRYLVENSLGRLWMLNNPGSRLIDRMEYYIKPEQEETDFLVIQSPEEIKICDPACGSGHMLVYAFEILYAIYEEQGYDAPQIPQLILKNNLYGIEIDERAGELAAFALCMKARGKYRRFFKKNIQPNICVLENVTFEAHEVKSYLDAVNSDLFSMELATLLYQFKEADNFGSLIRPELTNISDVIRLIDETKVSDDMFLQGIQNRVLKVLEQAEYLSPKYHVVIANPPYMGGKGMNARLSKWAKDNYADSKLDLFTMFMEKGLDLIISNGYMGMINLPSWLFLSTFKKLRKYVINKTHIESLLHMGRGIFGIDWGSTAFILRKSKKFRKRGHFFRLHKRNFQHIYSHDIAKLFLNTKSNSLYRYDFDKYRGDNGVNAINSEADINGQRIYYSASASDFNKIPGSPIAYWVSTALSNTFLNSKPIGNAVKKGLSCSGTALFYRFIWEVSRHRTSLVSGRKWFPITKGGAYRKWYGNNENFINWEKDGYDIKNRTDKKGNTLSVIRNRGFYFQEGVSWNDVSSRYFSCRYTPPGSIPTDSGPMLYSKDKLYQLCAFLNSNVARPYAKLLCPTIHFGVGQIASFPIVEINDNKYIDKTKRLISISRQDWNSHELSFEFSYHPILISDLYRPKLKNSYLQLRISWQKAIDETQRLEEEINQVFIKAYDLADELKPSVPINEITLTCNPHYRYNQKNEEELDSLILSDTMKEFMSYSVGCMFGRYSLDKEGLILANQGDTIENYLATVPEPAFKPDDDNVIPIMDVDWFPDDIVERFKRFLKVTFGEEHYPENLEFIEKAIGKDIRKFFLKDFYTYHIKMYKKRPIYWMFSSPKGSFNALIYMHRYKPDTVSIVLNDYLREFRTKLTARKDNLENIGISTSASQGEKAKALKEIEKIKKVLDETDGYERDILYPLATKQIEIDLDDGVKVNYPKFGPALKKVVGLS